MVVRVGRIYVDFRPLLAEPPDKTRLTRDFVLATTPGYLGGGVVVVIATTSVVSVVKSENIN
jgi:hypothetical protein